MKHPVNPIPEGFHSINPLLIVSDATQAIDFYKKAFGATEILRMGKNDQKVWYSELKIGDSMLMVCDELDKDTKGPKAYGGSPIGLHLYVPDVDATAKQAVAAGATLLNPIDDMFYGLRRAFIEDPFGHKWFVATKTEDLSPEEHEKRATEHGWIDLSKKKLV